MESVRKYFESSKKRDLSDGFKTSEEPKKLEKETTSASSTSDELDIFSDTLDNEDFRGVGILLNCFKKLEKEVKNIQYLVD